MNYNKKEPSLREQIEKAMQDNGMIKEQVAWETPIGTFHYDAENNPELVKANRRQQAMQYANVQQLRMPYGSERYPRFYVHRNKNAENPKTYSVWNGVPTAAVTGFFDGAFGGAERFTNGITFGGYGYGVDQFLNNAYSNRQNRLRNQAYNTGVGSLNNASNHLVDGSAMALRYLLK